MLASAAAYARERLGISPRKARALVALERKSAEAPALAAAYREGELSWLRALSLLPVAAPDTAGAWIERARAVTVRRLVDEVEWAVETRAAGGAAPVAPPTLGARLAVDQRQMRAHARQNRITGCGHHLRGIHQGRVRAWGTAPEDVTWELGVRPGRAPLLRLHGDVYVGAG